ncbi:MAG: hypothetical protein KAS38_03605 [Anaerolineales bacterium]|nr:hypothetical protein [Anaerolineales bacterium]MCK4978413.1 hypothetical protein [Anaerolineales bacterium]
MIGSDKYEKKRHKQQRFEWLFTQLIDKYRLAGFVVELAQLLYDEGISFKQTPVGVDIDYGENIEFDLEDEDILMLTGYDFETLGLTIKANKKASTAYEDL